MSGETYDYDEELEREMEDGECEDELDEEDRGGEG